jgi:hypothetical protein
LVVNTPNFGTSEIFSVQSLYTIQKHLKLYSEASSSFLGANDNGAARRQESILFGPVWESTLLTVQANYVSQTAAYLPIYGYLVGDRRGPYADVHFRPRPGIDVHGSASEYTNNLAGDNQVPTLHSGADGSGISVALPWRLTASADLSLARLRADNNDASTGVSPNSARQLTFGVARPFGRQTLRLSWLDIDAKIGNGAQRQQGAEVEDIIQWRRFTFGGAVRLQRETEQSATNSLFFRASAQVNLRRLSAYFQLQQGADLASQTLLATNAFSSTVFGLSAPLVQGWQVQVEAFRNQLTTTLNPASIFALQNQGASIPTTLAGFNQWSVFVKIGKHFRWGAAPQGSQGVFAQIPLLGSVEGFITESAIGETRRVGGVPVSLDDSRSTVTDDNGHYRFSNVPEGLHTVKLALQELPAELQPGANDSVQTRVQPRAVARTDFTVRHLTAMTGKVDVPKGISAESVILRLLGTGRYTTPDPDGAFGFYNLPEGDYEIAVDPDSLPENCRLTSAASQHIAVRLDKVLPPVEFTVIEYAPEKPVRTLFDGRIEISSR